MRYFFFPPSNFILPYIIGVWNTHTGASRIYIYICGTKLTTVLHGFLRIQVIICIYIYIASVATMTTSVVRSISHNLAPPTLTTEQKLYISERSRHHHTAVLSIRDISLPPQSFFSLFFSASLVHGQHALPLSLTRIHYIFRYHRTRTS